MMKRIFNFVLVTFLILVPPSSLDGGIDIKNTKLLAQPAVCQSHIAFVYCNDLWVAKIDGTEVRRLTTDEGIESEPAFSLDGKLVAFSAQYDGNTDVFVVPVEGGVPKRLTWHPESDVACGFKADGTAVLFTSPRFSFTNRVTQLYTVPIEGGFPDPLNIPNAHKAAYSPDGTQMAYTPLPEAFLQWKRYRGGRVSTIWVYKFNDHSVAKIPQPKGRCNDTDPMWIGNKIYFRSDRNGEFNLFSFDQESQEIKQLTEFEDFPILSASAGAGKIIFEQAGHLHIFEPQTGRINTLAIGVAADLMEVRPRYVKGTRYIRNASISPSGARAVFEFRGEIVTVPAEKGNPRNLTNTTGVNERSPVWSSDGKYIAYFSDASGEYELHIGNQDGKGEVRNFKLEGSGFYDRPVWSPDGHKISYTDNSWSLYWLDLKTGAAKKIASDTMYGEMKTINSAWSPDSKWVAYTLTTPAYMQRVYLYSLEEDRSYQITDGMSEVSEPVFDINGKYLYFLASTDAGPIKQWFSMSKIEMRMVNSIYIAVLQKGMPSPLAKKSDEEIGSEKEEKAKKEKSESEQEFTIDFDGLNDRILVLPVTEGNYFNLQAGDAGQIYYLEGPPCSRNPYERGVSLDKGVRLHRFDLGDRQDELLLSDVATYHLSADKKKFLCKSEDTWKIIPTHGKMESRKSNLPIDSIEVHIDPRSEWNQIFHDAWRINRDYFYDPNMHGVDWKAMLLKYEVFLPHLSCRSDLNRVIQWMCSELAVGHHSVRGGDTLNRVEPIPGGLLGADYSIENNRYRFTKVYGGLNWNPELRSPLTEPGVDVKEGEYLLAVQGRKLHPPTNLFSFFENTAGKSIEITVGPDPDGTGSRNVLVVPIEDEASLRNRDWVEGNLKKVDEATGGRVAYVYVPDTWIGGHTYFKRYFFPQVYKDAIIVDERYNRGGYMADYVIEILRRKLLFYWHMRYGMDHKTPGPSIQGPKVMLINEMAGSGGDALPYMFQKLGLGTLIGKRTWGGLVGQLGFPILMDGGSVTAPNQAIWDQDGFVVENVGVPPDIEVEQWPADVIAGKDPQLEKAIEVILKELENNPPKRWTRPPYPKR
jgi:tricorn protease